MRRKIKHIIMAMLAVLLAGLGCTAPGILDQWSPPQSGPVPEDLPDDGAYADTEIFVSLSGSDVNGDGTETSPFRHISHALSEASSGDTILIRAGTYEEQVRIRIPELTIRSYPGEQAEIHYDPYDEAVGSVVFFDVNSDGSRIYNLEITGGYYYGIYHFSFADEDGNLHAAENTLIDSCLIHDTGRDAIKVTPHCNGITVRNSEIYNTGVRDPSNADGIDNVCADYMTVQDSYIHNTATSGLYFKGGAIGCVAERLVVEDCGSMGILLGFDTSPEFFDLSENPDYYENIGGIVRNCIVRNTVYAGIGMYAAYNPKVYNNTIINTANSGHGAIYFGLTYQDWDPAAGRPASVNPVIRNNIVYQQTGNVFEIRYSGDLGGMSALDGSLDSDYNIYFASGSPAVFEDNRPGSIYSGDLNGWKVHNGAEENSFGLDPELDVDGYLTSGSPCINTGQNLTEVSYDVEQELRSGAYDIGADEY